MYFLIQTDSTDKYDPRDVERLEKDDSLVESYLTWRHFVVEDTLKMMDESLQWRKEYGLNDLTEGSIPKWMFETGAVYLHGYDKEGNKLFWFKVKLHVKDARTFLDKKKYVAFWLERYFRREPGMPLTVVFDMSESGFSNIDMEFVKYIVSCFRVYYPKMLCKFVFLYKTSAWKIVRSWLGPDAISKLKFVSKSDIQTYIDVEHLPPHMGGTDPFRYSYPPLLDDDFQSPISENGGLLSEDENESKDGETEPSSPLELSCNIEATCKPRKVNFVEENAKLEEADKIDGANGSRSTRRPSTTFKGPLLHISPAEELCFEPKDKRKCLITLNNVTKNPVAFKVRTTAPEKYRVKPSSSSCEPGASINIVVSLHGGSQASLQDRFLVMAAEMEQNAGAGPPDLAQFWKEIPKARIMEHRLRCFNSASETSCLLSFPLINSSPATEMNSHQDLQSMIMQVMASNSRLEQKLNQCLWTQKVLMFLLSVFMALSFGFSLLYARQRIF
uniref:Motile sperm domain containing 2 n=1 Tax=Scleropages formosus TaxID=113540 RepID=A0A8C9TBF3_SCLFO